MDVPRGIRWGQRCNPGLHHLRHGWLVSSPPLRGANLLRRIIKTNTANSPAGSQIQTSSLCKTRYPRALKKRPSAIGETRIGLQGRKYRLLSKGEKNATPRPPLVMASRTPWLAVAKNRYAAREDRPMLGTPRRNATIMATPAMRAAKTRECVNPLCPQKSPYRMPNRNPSTSRSGRVEHNAPVTQTRFGMPCR